MKNSNAFRTAAPIPPSLPSSKNSPARASNFPSSITWSSAAIEQPGPRPARTLPSGNRTTHTAPSSVPANAKPPFTRWRNSAPHNPSGLWKQSPKQLLVKKRLLQLALRGVSSSSLRREGQAGGNASYGGKRKKHPLLHQQRMLLFRTQVQFVGSCTTQRAPVPKAGSSAAHRGPSIHPCDTRIQRSAAPPAWLR